MDNKQKRRALIDPVLMLLRSRHVVIALVYLVVGTLVIIAPQLNVAESNLIILIIAILMVTLGIAPKSSNGEVDMIRLMKILDAIADQLSLDLDDHVTKNEEEEHEPQYPR